MARHALLALSAAAAMTVFGARAEVPPGDKAQGARLFRACAACHSLEPDRNMTGPSLSGVWGRKAGSLRSFERYSPALKSARVVWDEQTLDQWLKSPANLIPDNAMTFPGIADARLRVDLIAFLKEASASQASAPALARSGERPAGFQDLKKLGPNRQVRSIRACRDSYFVTTADRKTTAFWEPKSALQDRFDRHRTARRQADRHARRDDGRPRLGVLCDFRGDQSIHQAPMLTGKRMTR